MGKMAPERGIRVSAGPVPEKGLFTILFETALESAVKAFLVMVLGGIALGLVGGIWREMTPSRPPGFYAEPERAVASAHSHPWTASLTRHTYLIIFGLLFASTVGVRLVRQGRSAADLSGKNRLSGIARQLSDGWFGLLVGNAFGALISATIIVWVQRWSWPAILFNWLVESVAAGLQNTAQSLFGRGETVQSWFRWCGENQLRFTFWFLYLAAICDDLGIPNFKTLGRRLGRRLRRGTRPKAGAGPESPGPTPA